MLPTIGEIIHVDKVDYDMMSYLSRTNRLLLITMKNGNKVHSSVGVLYHELTFHGNFDKDVQYRHFSIQKKSFDKIQIIG